MKTFTQYNFLFLFLLLCACAENKKTNEVIATDNSDSIIAFEINELEKVMKGDDKATNDSINLYFKKEGLFKAFCPSDNGAEPFSQYKTTPFDTIIKKEKDTIVLSFKVSNSCCYNYYGNYYSKNDTLIIYYNYNGMPCDCTCDYLLTYKISKKTYNKNFVLKTDRETALQQQLKK